MRIGFEGWRWGLAEMRGGGRPYDRRSGRRGLPCSACTSSPGPSYIFTPAKRLSLTRNTPAPPLPPFGLLGIGLTLSLPLSASRVCDGSRLPPLPPCPCRSVGGASLSGLTVLDLHNSGLRKMEALGSLRQLQVGAAGRRSRVCMCVCVCVWGGGYIHD